MIPARSLLPAKCARCGHLLADHPDPQVPTGTDAGNCTAYVGPDNLADDAAGTHDGVCACPGWEEVPKL